MTEQVDRLKLMGERLLIIAALVRTYETPGERRSIINTLYDRWLISENAKVTLLEMLSTEEA